MNKKLIAVALILLSVAPLSVLAIDLVPQPTAQNVDIYSLINGIFNLIWPIIAAVTIILFVLSGFLYLTAQGEPAKIDKANQALIWGIIGIVVILLSFSLPFIIKTTLGV
jgi:hypothetical protein